VTPHTGFLIGSFHATYTRACENIVLNYDLAHKISAHNFGLSDTDEQKTVLIPDEIRPGSFSIRGWPTGTPQDITIRDAATVLEPIINAAKANGRDVIAKIDCEGAEFEVFSSLEKHRLLPEISAFMVEWHPVSSERTQHALIAPLVRHGFIVFDLSGRSGNGFFYAVRHAGTPRWKRGINRLLANLRAWPDRVRGR
jgi:hypothetical protein